MTRKKFVKNLMSYGLQRNEANKYAKAVRISGMSYAEYKPKIGQFVDFSFSIRQTKFAIDNFANAIRTAQYWIEKLNKLTKQRPVCK